ncbi:MAG: energy transducer TonB [Flavobacteriales bacterium]|nr:energy transducer TonB [Flavobacteriales bacterium]
MVSKKHALYRLEKKRSSFLAIGFMLSLFIVLTAMEWRTVITEEDNLVVYDFPDDTDPETPYVPPVDKPKPPDNTIDEGAPPRIDGEGEVKKGTFTALSRDTIEWDEEEEDWGYRYIPKPPVFWAPEMPKFRSGEKDRKAYLDKHIKYPQRAIDGQISGTVYVSFIVNTKGQVQQVKIKRGIGGGCDEEVIRVVKGMKGWKPGRQGDTKVAVIQTMPILFELQ